jgi:hypothetical protein
LGIGGDLIWTGVIRGLSDKDGRPVVVCKKPKFTDLVFGRLFNGYESLSENLVFKGNPYLIFLPPVSKQKPLSFRVIDRFFDFLVSHSYFKKKYETYIFKKSQSIADKGFNRLIHLDMLIHSYAMSQTGNKMIWKAGGHAIQIIAKNFRAEINIPYPEMYFSSDELNFPSIFLSSRILGPNYVVIEPGTNTDWFGDLRAWPIDRWQDLVFFINKKYPDVSVLQIGLSTTTLLQGVIDLRGKTSFREATLIIKDSLLFIGTEGGLMHAAAAVKARAIILWGGVTSSSFAGYPHLHTIISNSVPCAPCGQLGWCDNDRVCMNSIRVEVVQLELTRMLSEKINKVDLYEK